MRENVPATLSISRTIFLSAEKHERKINQSEIKTIIYGFSAQIWNFDRSTAGNQYDLRTIGNLFGGKKRTAEDKLFISDCA